MGHFYMQFPLKTNGFCDFNFSLPNVQNHFQSSIMTTTKNETFATFNFTTKITLFNEGLVVSRATCTISLTINQTIIINKPSQSQMMS